MNNVREGILEKKMNVSEKNCIFNVQELATAWMENHEGGVRLDLSKK